VFEFTTKKLKTKIFPRHLFVKNLFVKKCSAGPISHTPFQVPYSASQPLATSVLLVTKGIQIICLGEVKNCTSAPPWDCGKAPTVLIRLSVFEFTTKKLKTKIFPRHFFVKNLFVKKRFVGPTPYTPF
jgi:hypothetical protein